MIDLDIKDVAKDRLLHYNKEYCWQYGIRLNNLDDDLGLLPEGTDYTLLKVRDFNFRPMETQEERNRVNSFIKLHEWLGTPAMNTTHYFGAFYKDVLAGVVTFSNPTAYSKLLGEDTKDLERLISRGACISWSPKNLASAFVMWCIHYMVDNTQYRVFTAYSDPTARELGTIYQACNFYYLGNKFGSKNKYISPYSGKLVSDRTFRSRSYYKRYAQDLQIPWEQNWNKGDKVCWDNIPDLVEAALRDYGKQQQLEAETVLIPSKHKYAYVLGKDKRETKQLRKQLELLNRTYEYPSIRGL